jgi:hypothetical protein
MLHLHSRKTKESNWRHRKSACDKNKKRLFAPLDGCVVIAAQSLTEATFGW